MSKFLEQCGTLLTRLTCIKGTLGEERKEQKKRVKEIMTENLPNMIKNINLHGSAAQFQEETKIFAHRQIMVRLLKIKHQGKFLKTIRKIGHIQGNPHKIYI